MAEALERQTRYEDLLELPENQVDETIFGVLYTRPRLALGGETGPQRIVSLGSLSAYCLGLELLESTR